MPGRNRRRLNSDPAAFFNPHALSHILVGQQEIGIKPGAVLHHLPDEQRVGSGRNAMHFELALLACERGSVQIMPGTLRWVRDQYGALVRSRLLNVIEDAPGDRTSSESDLNLETSVHLTIQTND